MFIWFSSRYSALYTAKESLLKVGITEDNIGLIPQPVEPNKLCAPYQFSCPKYQDREKARLKGIDPVMAVCISCPLKKTTCPLFVSKLTANDKKIILLHSGHLRATAHQAEVSNLIMDRHVILDEDMDNDLLGLESISLEGLKIYLQTLKNIEIDEKKSKITFAHLKKSQELCQKLINLFDSIVKLTKNPFVISVKHIFENIPDFEKSNLRGLIGIHINRELIKKNDKVLSYFEQFKNIKNELLIQIVDMGDKFDVIGYYTNPAKLTGRTSLTVLDATNTEENIERVLEACHINNEIDCFKNHPAEQADTFQILGRNYSREFFKKYDNKEVQKLQNQLNKRLATQGMQRAVLITYKDLCDNMERFLSGVPRLTVLDGIHFGGQITGHNKVGEYFEQEGIPFDKAGLVVLGTPRQNIQELAKRAFAIGKFGLGDEIPEFDKDNAEADWHHCRSHEVKFMTYKDDVWRELDFYAINREIMQSVGRGAFRGIKTVVISNFPLPELKAERGGWAEFVGEIGAKGFETRLRLEKGLQLIYRSGDKIENLKVSDVARRCGLDPRNSGHMRIISEVLKQ